MKKPVLVLVDSKSSDIREFKFSAFKSFLIGFSLVLLNVLILKISFDFYTNFNHNSTVARLQKENALLQRRLKAMKDKVALVENRIKTIENVDDQIRGLLDLPAISEDVRKVGVGGSETVSDISFDQAQLPYFDDLLSTSTLIEKLEREIKLETTSYKQLLTTVERQQDSLNYLPALKPVPEAWLTDGFGYRRHPILKRIKFHQGVDLAIRQGTPIMATADGYVTFAGRNGGYGNFVAINHKYGFETHYGHMRKIYVRVGQFVHRGDKIGEVGSTGLSTNPHLHYEVLYHGKHKNPVQFFLNDVKRP